ncbi:MAG: hypothetical protein AAF686_02245 [Pseudomonadota bacterium]
MNYHETLVLYYEEEVEGEAYFLEWAKAFEDPDHCAKMVLMGEVERHAAAAVRPLLEKYGLTPRAAADLVQSGVTSARKATGDWTRAIDEMTETFPGYIDDFERLEAMAPSEDRARLNFLTEHEVAAIKFLELEKTNPSESAAPLRDYLATPAETWAPKAA